MPRPARDRSLHRRHARQVKLTDAELQAWNALLRSMAALGPPPHEAHALLWLIEQECARRGIPWPSAPSPENEPADKP